MTGAETDLPEPILEAAAIWHARLRDAGGDVDTDIAGQNDIQAAFQVWLQADPRHARAFDDMQILWGALEKPVEKLKAEQKSAMQRMPSRRLIAAPPKFWAWRPALLAVLLLAAGIGLVLQGDMPTRWRADYVADIGETASLTLADQSLVVLNSQAALSLRFTPAERRVRLLRGEAWFEVSPTDPRPFLVETAGGVVRVTGTSFNLRIVDANTVVSLVEGRVELRPAEAAGKPPVLLAPGREAVLSATAVSPATPFDRLAITAWQRGQFVFFHAPLADVVAALNRHRSGHILILDTALNDLKVSGVFSTRNPDAALEAISNTLPVRMSRLSDHLVLLRQGSNAAAVRR